MAHNIYILVSFMDVMFDSFIIHWFDYTKAIMYSVVCSDNGSDILA